LADTIFAMTTPRGKSGVAVIRVSGPDAKPVASTLCGSLPEARSASLRNIRDHDGTVLDQALVLVFNSGQSFTGEDIVEFQVHGSMAVTNAVLNCLSRFDGLRFAEAGEFTRRALVNERLDLTQVEGLADLIDSETEWQRRQAMKVFSGALGAKVEDWRNKLIRAAALLEATIDFADEDVPVDVFPEVISLLAHVRVDLDDKLTGAAVAERIRDGFEVAIVGPPNVGKSTLLNTLAGRQAAITSEVAGTTRDVIEVRMDLDGMPVTLLDTAGLREAVDKIEEIGISHGIKRAKSADLRVFLHSGETDFHGIKPQSDDIEIRGKADLALGSEIAVSGKTGQGISALLNNIRSVLASRAVGSQTTTRLRHRVAIEKSSVMLRELSGHLESRAIGAEIAAEDLRSAVRVLDSLVGRIGVETLLDEIFSSFCIGK